MQMLSLQKMKTVDGGWGREYVPWSKLQQMLYVLYHTVHHTQHILWMLINYNNCEDKLAKREKPTTDSQIMHCTQTEHKAMVVMVSQLYGM